MSIFDRRPRGSELMHLSFWVNLSTNNAFSLITEVYNLYKNIKSNIWWYGIMRDLWAVFKRPVIFDGEHNYAEDLQVWNNVANVNMKHIIINLKCNTGEHHSISQGDCFDEVCSKVSPESGFIKMHVNHSGFLVIFTIVF